MTTAQGATRAETVADVLRRAIQAGERISGERLVELTLAQKLNVSQNTVRDALRILEGEGWVVKHARRGVYVRSYTPDEALELYTLWATLEGLAVRWAVEALTRGHVGQLRNLIAQGQLQIQRGDIRGSVETIFTLHETIWRIPGRAQTAGLLNMLRNQVRLLEQLRQMRAPLNLSEQEARLAAYEQVVDAIESGDAHSAQEAIHDLIMADCRTLLPLLASSA